MLYARETIGTLGEIGQKNIHKAPRSPLCLLRDPATLQLTSQALHARSHKVAALLLGMSAHLSMFRQTDSTTYKEKTQTALEQPVVVNGELDSDIVQFEGIRIARQ